MSAAYSTRFLAALPGQGANYTVPAGKLAVVRCLTVYNTSTTTVGSFNLELGPAGVNIVGSYLPALTQGSTAHQQVYDLRVVFNAGELIELAVAAAVAATVSGYLLVA